MKSAKSTHTSVWIAQDTTESRVPRLNVHSNQILVHTFSHGGVRTMLLIKHARTSRNLIMGGGSNIEGESLACQLHF